MCQVDVWIEMMNLGSAARDKQTLINRLALLDRCQKDERSEDRQYKNSNPGWKVSSKDPV